MTTTITQFAIRQNKNFYGPETQRSLVTSDDGYALLFDSKQAAEDHIEMLDDAVYYTSNNESGRPDYAVIRADKLPAYLSNQL